MSDRGDSLPLGCPTSLTAPDRVLLGHGGGGRLGADLLRELFLPAFADPVLAELEDQAALELVELIGEPGARPNHLGPDGASSHLAGASGWNQGRSHDHLGAGRLALTTDSFVVRPLFFPGGDIGSLAVHGTVNDLAVGGATPRFLSAAFILEEGLPLDDLRKIVESMRRACREAGVRLVTGDTKVVERGKGDGVFITTTGVGWIPAGCHLSQRHVRAGDRVVVSGTIGDHGIAILSVREGLEFETELRSDSASLHELSRVACESAPGLRWMRDPTRGGVSSALNELAGAARVGVRMTEAALPIRAEVRGACELLGLDPLYVANEGKLLAVVAAEDAERLVEALRAHPLGRDARVIGEVVSDHPGIVTMRTSIGGERIVSMLAGEQLPRIC